VRILTVVGTRPQLIKAAALSPVLRTAHDEILVDTGQHYDPALAGDFFVELGLAAPDRSLGVGGGTHAEQTGAMLIGLESIVASVVPDAIMVYGDTNSTLAGALVAAKASIPLAHVEAGLRSFDRRMPEEVNRVVTDHLARWRFAPTPAAVANLAAEGIVAGVHETGDLMQDLAARTSREVRDPAALAAIDVPGLARPLSSGGYLFATIHRAENRASAAMASWVALVRAAAGPDRPVILALHPGTQAALGARAADLGPDVVITPPYGYRSSLTLQLHAAAVLTDSGGVQREAGWLGVPCLVLRSSTEWVELLAASEGRMVLVGLDQVLASATLAALAPSAPGATAAIAAERIATLDVPPAGAADAITATLAAEAVPA
jgi:UDP-GlcNAc3NAcA epimerase